MEVNWSRRKAECLPPSNAEDKQRVGLYLHSHLCLNGMHQTILLTYSMEQSSFLEANQLSASQEILCILWNLQVHYRIHKCACHLSLSRATSIQSILISHFLKIHHNIILSSMSGSSNRSLSRRCSHQNSVYTSTHPPCMLHVLHPSFFSI